MLRSEDVDLVSWTEMLAGWNVGAARGPVARVRRAHGAEHVPVDERVAVFDNDATMWREQPLPTHADFILRRLVEMAQGDHGLRGRQPWKAAYERYYGSLGAVLVPHYAGDVTDLPALASGILAAFDGFSVEDFEAKAGTVVRTMQHLTLARACFECACAAMLDLLGYLRANGFSTFIAR